MPTFIIFILIFFLLPFKPLHLTCNPILLHHPRILHQPFFPLHTFPPTLSPSPSPSPQPQPQQQQQQPKFPFSSTPNKNHPFFPSSNPSTPPPPHSSSSLATFPADISSLVLPQSPHRKRTSLKLLSIIFSLLSVIFITFFSFLIYRRRRRQYLSNSKDCRSDSQRLFPANASSSSEGHHKVPGVSATSSEFLYLGTLVNSRGIDGNVDQDIVGGGGGGAGGSGSSSPYRKLSSPELLPLPPLSRQNVRQSCGNADVGSSGEDEFYSPRGSSGGKGSPVINGSSSRRVFQAVATENYGTRSSNSSSPSYPSSNSASPSPSICRSPSPPVGLSPRSSKSNSPGSAVNLPPPQPSPPRPMTALQPPSSPPIRALEIRQPVSIPTLPPPPPPPLPPRFWEAPVPPPLKPPVLITPSRPIVFQNSIAISPAELPQNSEGEERNEEEAPKLKLKPLHWDKVRASSDRAMVWDQLKSSSFQLNEEMMETLFIVNGTNPTSKEMTRHPILPSPNQENMVLDPKKSQNIAILLRALNVTVEEVCEALLEGNTDTLGTELLESLLKMAPTKDEEHKLKEYKDDSPLKLGSAERFLKAVLDIPFAFKRADAMLYIANFDSEVEHLRKSFETLEAACEELRNSRMFLKLLEAVLKTGNRMNVGTNRGDAHAFKLDTLLKLVDVKGTDGKTTLLHFVVQEIIRAEGSRLSGANENPTAGHTQQSTFRDDIEFRKLGLQVVSGISGELTNVKKSAAMDSDVLSSDVSKLARGIGSIGEVLRLNEAMGMKESSERFSESMNGFLKNAEEEIIRIQAHESVALSLVKEITEYFHGNSAKEEAHPFRIFMVVRDFLSILDRVCREVGKINERTIVSSAHQFPVPINPTLPSVFPRFHAPQQYSSSDDESCPTS